MKWVFSVNHLEKLDIEYILCYYGYMVSVTQLFGGVFGAAQVGGAFFRYEIFGLPILTFLAFTFGIIVLTSFFISRILRFFISRGTEVF